MNKSIIGAVLVLLVIALVGFVVLSGDDNSTDVATSQSTSEAATTQAPVTEAAEPATASDAEEQAEFTATEVATHNSESDCWTIIEQQVYDITAYVPRHPGGDEILRACGADGTSLFIQRSTVDGETVGSGTPHSSNATSQLEGFFLGIIVE